MVAVGLGLLAAAAPADAATDATDAEVGATWTAPMLPPPPRAEELRVAVIGRPLTLNPALAPTPATTIPGAQLFVSLFRLGADGEPEPYLAERWRLAADRRSLEVHLVPGTRFHDGTPVTAADVAFSILATRDHHTMSAMLRPVAAVETPTPLTVVIRLSEPHPALYQALATPLTPILPAHVYGDGRPLASHPANLAPVGSGPFRFDRWDEHGRLILRRFEDFFVPGRPLLERIVIEYFEDTRQIEYAIAAGDLDVAPLIPTTDGLALPQANAALVARREGVDAVGPLSILLIFNLRQPPFDDRRVRQAIAWALHPDDLAATRFLGELLPLGGPFSVDHPFAHDAMQRYRPPDTEQAERLLLAAGLPRAEDGSRLRVPLLVGYDTPALAAIADGLRWHLGRKLGIEIDAQLTPTHADWMNQVRGGDFTLALDARLFWGDPLFGVHRTYQSRDIRADGIFTNYAGYAEPQVDAWLDAAARESDPERRRALYRLFQAQVAVDLPYLWLAQLPLHALHRRDLCFPLDNARAVVAPYDRVHWRDPAAVPAVAEGCVTDRAP